jgi:hypothetical protein
MAESRLISASDPQCLYIDDSSAKAALAATVPCRFEVEDLASYIWRTPAALSETSASLPTANRRFQWYVGRRAFIRAGSWPNGQLPPAARFLAGAWR